MPSRLLIALAALGAVVGSSARYGIALAIPNADGSHIPYATLLVNLIGSLIIGVCASMPRIMTSEVPRTFFVTGILGGFTTFSAFAVETVELSNRPVQALIYVLLTVTGSLAATHWGAKLWRTA